MSNLGIIETICKEREELRQEILELTRTIAMSCAGCAAAFVSGMAVYFAPELISNQEHRVQVLVVLSQIVVLFGYVVIVCLINQGVHAGYIRALERFIEKLHGQKVAIWEHEIVKNHITSPRSAHFWVSAAITFLAFATLGSTAIFVYKATSSIVLLVVLVLEGILGMVGLLWGGRGASQVEAEALTKFGVAENKDPIAEVA